MIDDWFIEYVITVIPVTYKEKLPYFVIFFWDVPVFPCNEMVLNIFTKQTRVNINEKDKVVQTDALNVLW